VVFSVGIAARDPFSRERRGGGGVLLPGASWVGVLFAITCGIKFNSVYELVWCRVYSTSNVSVEMLSELYEISVCDGILLLQW